MSIAISKDLEKEVRQYFDKYQFGQIAVLMDNNTERECYPLIENIIPAHRIISISAGEEHKNLETCQIIWNQLTSWGFTRDSLLINLGGGVIGDMGGFCAATFKRGIRFLNLPTTLLAQVDATVGGKLGIDYHSFKNHIGIFQEPDHIIIDPLFLKTLPLRELKSGFAEVIKHGLIDDSKTFDYLENTPFDKLDWNMLISRSVKIKESIVDKDPKENGLRKILNFGHTIGHVIESYSLENSKSRLLHGEAIILGMIAESSLSFDKNGLPAEELERITGFLNSNYDLKPPEISQGEFYRLLKQDKKNTGSSEKIAFSLLNRIGSTNYEIKITQEEAWEAFTSLT